LWLRPLAMAVAIVLLGMASAAAADADAEKTALAVEALSRLQGVDLNTNPRLQASLLKVLEKTRGTPDFVKLVKHFGLTNQNAGLLEVAAAQPSAESGVEAMRMLLANGEVALVEQMLASSNTVAATRTTEALGNAAERQATKLLLPVVKDSGRDLALRKQAVRALARTSDGATAVLKMLEQGTLAEDLKPTAGAELSQVRWPEIQSAASKLLPPAQARDAQPLPPIATLLSMKGDISNGARVFTNASVGCANCHVIRGHGTELGPNLSEIGTKLGKDALFEAILQPSAGISFGFEAFNLVLRNGDEAYGLIASETADELALKAVGGIVTRFKKSEIISRQASKLSMMPAGLEAAMTSQELVDLVEYLSSLKKQ
jgi:putative heme-binding domain-containing protein